MAPSGRLVKQQKCFSLGQAQVGVGGLPTSAQSSEAGARPWVCVPHLCSFSKTACSLVSCIGFLPGALCSQNF